MKYEIIDNFLHKDDWINLKNNMLENWNFPWNLKQELNDNQKKEDLSIYFTHTFYYDFEENTKPVSYYFKYVEPVLSKIKYEKIIRIVGNLYSNTKEIVEHANHLDFDFPHTAFIYYINDNNGFTILDDKIKIESKSNRLLKFDGLIQHKSTTCSDKKFRVNINFNVKEKNYATN